MKYREWLNVNNNIHPLFREKILYTRLNSGLRRGKGAISPPVPAVRPYISWDPGLLLQELLLLALAAAERLKVPISSGKESLSVLTLHLLSFLKEGAILIRRTLT